MRLLHDYFLDRVENAPERIAVVFDGRATSYRELSDLANRWGHLLRARGIGEGDLVGVLIPRSVELYAVLLAVLEVGAAYVPFDPSVPSERLAFVLADCRARALVAHSSLLPACPLIGLETVIVDQLRDAVPRITPEPISLVNTSPDSLCYVIYTSGTTGEPKGVEITHANVCSYLDAVAPVYKWSPEDRVYQGFSPSFDASVEEIWLTFATGATLIPAATPSVAQGVGLVEFLTEQLVTVFSTVPTLLGMLEGELPTLRLIILGGETCPDHLVSTWSRPSLTILNTYGPTEGTVVATCHFCEKGCPVTIGYPLAHCEALVLDDALRPVPDGEIGELCLTGPGVSRGYLRRPELTVQKFVPHPTDPTRSVYRTGDLALYTRSGELQFAGRKDHQIKLRGFRIELEEIESVLARLPDIRQSAVGLHVGTAGVPLLVAYLVLKEGARPDLQQLKAQLANQLPPYMIPDAFEILPKLPLLASHKIDRKRLPPPTADSLRSTSCGVAPRTDLEKRIVACWEGLFGYSPIGVTADFFTDLGGHSLMAARAVSALRKTPEMRHLSLADLYHHPSAERLARKLNQEGLSPAESEPVVWPDAVPSPAGLSDTARHFWCAAAQALACVALQGLRAVEILLVVWLIVWAATSPQVGLGLASLLVLGLTLALPLVSLGVVVATKWIVLGRAEPGRHRLWGLYYFRWWLVHQTQETLFPLDVLRGTPVLGLCFRLMGAQIGRRCHIETHRIATYDLITIGDDTSIGADSNLRGYTVQDGWLVLGPIDVGRRCHIGQRCVVGHHTVIEDGSLLEDLSMLPSHQRMSAGATYAGSPAIRLPRSKATWGQPTPTLPSPLRRVVFTSAQLLVLFLLDCAAWIAIVPAFLLVDHLNTEGQVVSALLLGLPVGAATYVLLLTGQAVFVKRLLIGRVAPGCWPLYGLVHLRAWATVRLLDAAPLRSMADSLYLPLVLRGMGARMGRNVECGGVSDCLPEMLHVADEGFLASSPLLGVPRIQDGYLIVGPVEIGTSSMVGNYSVIPVHHRLEDRSLLGLLSLSPTPDEGSRADTAWFGSPPILLPRREAFEGFPDHLTHHPSPGRIALRLLVETIRVITPATFELALLAFSYWGVESLSHWLPRAQVLLAFPVLYCFILLGLLLVAICLKWVLLGRLKPKVRPLWSPFIWVLDIVDTLFDDFVAPVYVAPVLGTPFAGWILRALGSGVGERVFIDTLKFAEHDLIAIADDACINAESVIQTHLYEDRIFKVGALRIGARCTVGTQSIVLYDTVMEEGAVLGDLSLLMKGETLPAGSSWEGLPAQHMLRAQLWQRAPEPASV